MVLLVLFESASGFALFEAVENAEIALTGPAIQQSVTDFARFGKVVKAVAFAPFKSALHALENINAISEGILHDYLNNFLEMNVAKVGGKKSKVQLGVADARIASSITDSLGLQCKTGDVVNELLRGVRLHFTKLTKELREGDVEKAQLGLGHSYSRAKVKFNVNRVDNMIIQAISLLDQLDKDVNTFSMRIREWYSYHFPELVRIVNDNTLFARLARFIGSRKTLNDQSLEGIEAIVMDTGKAKQILDAARSSMGMDIADIDLVNIEHFADRVISLSDYRKNLHEYLSTKMGRIAPNLSALVGEQVGARLISHAGSLTNLAKYPASTVQILGAEKALFRALKTKGNTPKYGLIFHSTFIGRAGVKNKGRISRYLANKCSKASRIDCFSDLPTSKFGSKFREQVEERLAFYETGQAPRKNADVMKEALREAGKEQRSAEDESEAMDTSSDKKDKKDKKEKKEKKEKKDKKDKSEPEAMDTSSDKKSKKVKSK
ncbi:nucleolar protein 5A [Capsaspora owczarzaki ATCC 30864]|uniref:nucleolar protein 5A n=1 Tax=Capsaspora owczarzaki (strain ATCC 30864) TaxID=595528 RepID=UPI0003524CE2|nr:nucleolar protein 5A [Capsaspora owczarzaki ATCC 30864]|eukprot:XP_004345107.2 nucleolar protein 5A [Capsaspora owczarzaki ATCC 30864]